MTHDLECEQTIIRLLEGGPLFAGSFGAPGEPEALERLIERGHVTRYYEGFAGLLGLSRVRLA